MQRPRSGQGGSKGRGDSAPRPRFTVFGLRPAWLALYAFAVVVAIAAGYGAGLLIADLFVPSAPPQVASAPPSPAPAAETPPGRATGPDAPIYPEALEDVLPHLALPYEEALPAEVHPPRPEPPARALPPIVTPPRPAIVDVSPIAPPEGGEAAPESPPAIASLPRPPDRAKLPPWQQYALAVPLIAGRPKIVIVIDDLGVDKRRSAQVIGFKAPLTLAFLSYASGLGEQTRAARANGHELLVHVPMQPSGAGVDPGPNALLSGQQEEKLLEHLRWALDQFPAYIGINNHMGSRFTADAAGMAVVLGELKRRGLMFLDSRTTGGSVGHRLAREIGVPFAERNVFLDNDNDLPKVQAQLRELEAVARKSGHAVAIGHPRDATIQALALWLPGLEERGFQLVPLSAVVVEEGGR